MTTFDEILPRVADLLDGHHVLIGQLAWLVINRDLSGRVRLLVPEEARDDKVVCGLLERLVLDVAEALGPHAYAKDNIVLYESDRSMACQGASTFPMEGSNNVWIADRLASEGDWADISDETKGPKRVVFYSIKGGVGRSTAVAATAWWLAEAGKRVLVLDLDLASPGLSSSLLPEDRKPTFGVTDWLVEDLVDNGNVLLDVLYATSDLSRDGEIYIVPAHGKDAGEYVSKLGRIGMPKLDVDGGRERWSQRLCRLLRELEDRLSPDVVLIDSRSGIDEMASACVTDLGANLVLLFALYGTQTWTGYRVLFEYWRRRDVVEKMRERLQLVGAMMPELNQVEYMQGLRDHAYAVFAESLYDDIPPGSVMEDSWHFESTDVSAPHYPWGVKWHRSFTGLATLRGRMAEIDSESVNSIFGPLVAGVARFVGMETDSD